MWWRVCGLMRMSSPPGSEEETRASEDGDAAPPHRGEDDDTVYVWTRRFESEAEREALYAAVHESDHWKNEVAPKVPELIDRSGIKVTRIVPTSRSVSQ